MKAGYPVLYVLGLLFAAAGCFGLFVITSEYPISIPIEFDSVYNIFRTTVSIAFFTFFLLLMVRQALLVVISMADQVDRSLGERRRHGKPEFLPLVSIVIPAYNEDKCIENSIRSLVQLDYPKYEVLVVDDGSTDDTLARARTLEGQHGNVRVAVFWKPNGGKASALNFGIQRAAADFVTTMDSDSVFEAGTIRAAVRHFEDPNVGAVAGNVRVGNTINVWTRLQALEYLKGLNLVRRAQGFIRASSVVPGPIGVFRKSALASVGYYDGDTFAEDCDLTVKLVLGGWKIYYEPLAVARTEAPENLLALMKQRYRWTRGILQTIRKHKTRLFWPRGSFMGWLILWYLLFEALVWPTANALSLAFLALASLDSALHAAAAYYWLQILLLEMVTAWYCVGIEERDLRLAIYSPIEKLVFQIVIDICKMLATVEELWGFKMTWGKLERTGRT
jgi:cellulose synthase/poly-beta-1,6-N-acetylglucosamine synthase-like glycosyltransferase